MDIIIRNADVSDAPIICDFIHKLAEYQGFAEDCTLTPSETEMLMKKANGLNAVIAELDGKPIGFASYFYMRLSIISGKKILYIEDSFVDEEFRNNGVGTALFDELAKIGKAKNCLRLEWKCLSWNENAIKFYESVDAGVSEKWVTFMKKLK